MSCPVKNSQGSGDAGSWISPDLPPKCTWKVNSSQPSPHTKDILVQNRTSVYPNVLHAIGDTPMVRLERLEKQYGLKCKLLGKCEFFNAGGSVKDRIALRMVEDAEKEGRIKPGYTLIEPTSGNTGVGLALAAAVKGYRCIIVMPEKMSTEKANVLKALGAELVRTPTSARYDVPESHIRVAQKLEREIPNAVILDQYRNPGNPVAHYDTTAEEILTQCDGKVDMLIGGAGTGGTITGIGRKFKEKCPNCKIIGIDPEGSDLALPVELNITDTTSYEVEGIGYDFIPTVFDRSVIDKWYKSNDKDSLVMARNLIRMEGLLCGGSSGTAVAIAVEAAKELKEGQTCVVVLPDSIRNYMTKHLMEDWMIERNFLPCKEATNYWWSDLTINDMTIKVPSSILLSTECKTAVEYMKEKSFDQLPVVDENGKLQGIITIASITSNFVADKIKMTDPVSECLYSKFKQLTVGTKLSMLSHVLESDHFVVVVGPQLQYNLVASGTPQKKVHEAGKEKENIYGIVTCVDLLDHITINKPKK